MYESERALSRPSADTAFLELTQPIPPKGCQHVRRYGLNASRGKGKWSDKPHVVRLAPPGWKKNQLQASKEMQPYDAETAYCDSDKESRRAHMSNDGMYIKVIVKDDGIGMSPSLPGSRVPYSTEVPR